MCDKQRENDIETLARAVLENGIQFEYNSMGADRYRCVFCYNSIPDYPENSREDIKHELNCPYLIAKDLVAGRK